MNVIRLIDVVSNLRAYEDELTIYAPKPWSCDSPVILAREADEGGPPPEVKACGAEYFIEVFVARQFLDDWINTEGRPIPAREQCERLIHYARYDA